ncbi:MAG: hypothetical protein JJT94_09060 [Bernardetiaceae bacterium]|nr:hypothetical protein [Bernardetiaceae bacterium]
MSKSKKNLIGVLAIAPLGVMAFAVIFVILFFVSAMGFLMSENTIPIDPSEDGVAMFVVAIVMFGLISLSALIIYGLAIYFVIHSIQDKSIAEETRIIWIAIHIAGLFMGFSAISNIIYWVMRIRPEHYDQHSENQIILD